MSAPHSPGGREQGQREQVRRDDHERAGGVRGGRERAMIAHRAVRRRILDEDRADAGVDVELRRLGDDDRHAPCRGARAHDVDRLRMAARVDEHGVLAVARDAVRHRDRFGGRRALVEQRRVRDRQRGEVADHRLVVEQRLEAPLRDLGLVRRVRRVPARILEHVALDHRGRVRARVAHADERTPELVTGHLRAERSEGVLFGARGRKVERAAEPDVGGDHRVDERVERGVAEGVEHGADVGVGRPDVARDERVGLRNGVGHGSKAPSRRDDTRQLIAERTDGAAMKTNDICTGGH